MRWFLLLCLLGCGDPMTLHVAAPSRIGAPGHLAGHWKPGPYTVALWHFNVPSGSVTDEVNGIVLTPGGTPTYGVSGPAPYSAWRGVALNGTTDYFAKLSPSPALDLGVSDNIVFQALFRAHSVGTRNMLFHMQGTNLLADYTYITTRLGNFASPYGVDVFPTAVAAIRSTGLTSLGDLIHYRFLFNMGTAKSSGYENDTVLYVDTAVTMFDVVNQSVFLGVHRSLVSMFFDGDIFAIKIDKGTDAAVLNVDDGPSQFHLGPPTRFP